MKPEELDKKIDKGEIAPLYFIFGDEEFLVERFVQKLVNRLVSPDFKDFNYSLFYGKECRIEQLLESAMTMPMFAERRVILVKRAEELQADALDQLLVYMKQPSPDCCLIFQGTKIDQRRKLFQELKKLDLLVEYKKLKDEQLAGFVRREAESSGKRLDAEAAEMLVYYSGNNLRELVAQIEKLAAYCGDRVVISVDDVRSIASDTKIDTVFELADALGNRDLDRAMRQLHTVMRDTDAPYMLIGALARHFRQLCTLRALQEKKLSQEEMCRVSKVSPYFIRNLLAQARRFKADEFKEIFSQLHGADLGLKSGGRFQALLEMLVFSICRGT